MDMEAMMSSLVQDIAPSETITTEVIDKIADIVSNIMKYRRNEVSVGIFTARPSL